MPLIPCCSALEAVYQHNADGGLYGVPVEAFDDAGTPYVAGRTALVPAAEWRSANYTFLRLGPRVSSTGPAAVEPVRFPVRDRDEDGGR